MKARSTFWSLVFFQILILGLMAQSVDATPDQESNEEKQKARLSLSYVNYNNYGPRLNALVRVRVERSYQGVKGVRVDFYHKEISADNKIGFGMTNDAGEAVLGLPDTFYKALDTTDYFTYYAVIEDDAQVMDNDDEINITRSHIELNLEEIDSVKTITFSVSAPGDTVHLVPVEEVEASIFIERLFGFLPVAEFEYTDSDGQIVTEIGNDIPGDEDGNIVIRAVIEDHEEFGTLIATRKINWGLSKSNENHDAVGELWSNADNAPLYLVILITSLVAAIWGVIFYLIMRILQIRKLGIN